MRADRERNQDREIYGTYSTARLIVFLACLGDSPTEFYSTAFPNDCATIGELVASFSSWRAAIRRLFRPGSSQKRSFRWEQWTDQLRQRS